MRYQKGRRASYEVYAILTERVATLMDPIPCDDPTLLEALCTFADELAQLPDPRGVRYPLVVLLGTLLVALAGGSPPPGLSRVSGRQKGEDSHPFAGGCPAGGRSRRTESLGAACSRRTSPKRPRDRAAWRRSDRLRPGRGLTVPEIRRLWQCLLLPLVTDMAQAWSYWYRHHQWVALHCHYRRQQATTL